MSVGFAQVSYGGGSHVEEFLNSPENAAWLSGPRNSDTAAAMRVATGSFSMTRASMSNGRVCAFFVKSRTRGGNWMALVSTTYAFIKTLRTMGTIDDTRVHAKLYKTEDELFSIATKDSVFACNAAFCIARDAHVSSEISAHVSLSAHMGPYNTRDNDTERHAHDCDCDWVPSAKAAAKKYNEQRNKQRNARVQANVQASTASASSSASSSASASASTFSDSKSASKSASSASKSGHGSKSGYASGSASKSPQHWIHSIEIPNTTISNANANAIGASVPISAALPVALPVAIPLPARSWVHGRDVCRDARRQAQGEAQGQAQGEWKWPKQQRIIQPDDLIGDWGGDWGGEGKEENWMRWF